MVATINNNVDKNADGVSNNNNAKKQLKTPQDILDAAPEILSEVDQAAVFKRLPIRDFPTFTMDEIVKGPLLGKGGFGAVTEVVKIELRKHQQNDDDKAVKDYGDGRTMSVMKATEDDNNHLHYNVDNAREYMSKNYLRFGNARYAVKKLRTDLSEMDNARGMVDLAIEIRFFKVLWHPNIVKMRGYAESDNLLDKNMFIVMDRLYGTLDDRLEEWMDEKESKKSWIPFSCDKDRQNRYYKELAKRMLIAYDLAAAIVYMHNQKLLYRDIKPENIGFDVRDDVKVFDFGLMKSMDAKLKAKDGSGIAYHLTARTGSIPYMAPEIASKKPYGDRADVFSFSILLWEILSLKWAFNGYTTRDYLIKVVNNKKRLPISKKWPVITRTVLQEAWDDEPTKRPTMKRMSMLIRGDVQELMDQDSEVVNRTSHMSNKSMRSQRYNRRRSSNLSNSASSRLNYSNGGAGSSRLNEA